MKEMAEAVSFFVFFSAKIIRTPLRKRFHSAIMETGNGKRVSKQIMKREEIVQEAIRQFQISGLKFTMNDIAASLHIAKKTIYQFYESKEELLSAMLAYGFSDIQKKKQEILASDLDLIDKIRMVMIAMPNQYQVLDFRRLSDLHEKYPKISQELVGYLENDWEPVIRLLEEGVRQHRIRPVSIPILRTMFTASLESFLSSETLNEEHISYNEALEQMMDIIMNGIKEHDYEEKN